MLLRQLERSLQLQERPNGRAFLLGWSGGPDSTALFYLMLELRKQYNFRFNCLHINFGLRGADANADENFCRSLAKDKDVGLIVYRAPSAPESGIQEWARGLRLKVQDQLLPDFELLEAHQADDQVETFLFRLFRGSGVDGLEGMKLEVKRGSHTLLRPLLNVRKKDLLEYLKAFGYEFRKDSTNDENDYDRNYIRNELIPRIESRFSHFRHSVLRLQDQIAEERAYFSELLKSLDICARLPANGPISLPRAKLQELPKTLRRRFIHSLFKERGGISLSREQVLEFEEKLCSTACFAFNAPKGLVVRCGVRSSPNKELVEFDF